MGGVWRAHADAVCTSAVFVVPLSVTLPRSALGVIELSPSRLGLCCVLPPKTRCSCSARDYSPALLLLRRSLVGWTELVGSPLASLSFPSLPPSLVCSPSLISLLRMPVLFFCLSLSARSTGESSQLFQAGDKRSERPRSQAAWMPMRRRGTRGTPGAGSWEGQGAVSPLPAGFSDREGAGAARGGFGNPRGAAPGGLEAAWQ